jgi:hypothetical protein
MRSMFMEREIPWTGREDNRIYLIGANLISDLDDNGRPIVKFVRTADRDEIRERAPVLTGRLHPADMYTDLYEVMYMFKDKATDTTLYRGVRYFNRSDRRGSFFTATKISSDPFKPVDSGVLYLEFRYWGQNTTTWTKASAKTHARSQRRTNPKREVESEIIWDSSRNTLPAFRYRKRGYDPADPDQTYPEMVRVTLVVKAQTLDARKVFLTSDLKTSGNVIRVNSTSDIPDPPGMVRIGSEWIEYSSKDFSSLRVKKRGARSTKKTNHRTQSEVLFGERFTRIITLPVRMEAMER